MESSIQFTCTQCGNHQLILVVGAMHRYVVRDFACDQDGKLFIGKKVLIDDLCGDPLGYRCAECRYPDCGMHESTDGFLWRSLEEVQRASAISWPSGMEPVEHRCMICFPNGQ